LKGIRRRYREELDLLSIVINSEINLLPKVGYTQIYKLIKVIKMDIMVIKMDIHMITDTSKDIIMVTKT
jgi:hypothetical protein